MNFFPKFRRYSALIALGYTLTACQSVSTPSMSLEEARGVAVNFKMSNYVAPRKNIDKYRTAFQNGRPVPKSCQKDWDQWEKNLADMQEGLKNAQSNTSIFAYGDVLVLMAEGLVAGGNYNNAVEIIEDVRGTYPRLRSVKKAQTSTQLARLHAKMGNLSSARGQMRTAASWWTRSYKEFGGGDAAVQMYTNAGQGTIAMMEGQLPLAEHYFRTAMQSPSFKTGIRVNHINRIELQADLARVILMQGRPFEAEVVARTALDWRKINSPNNKEYRGYNADIVLVLGQSLLEQGKYDDAEYLARIALNMHESTCSRPESFGITRARQTFIDMLAEQGKWPEIIEQVKTAQKALVDFPTLYEDNFATSLAYVEALLQTGRTQEGLRLANQLKDTSTENSHRHAQLSGLIALGLSDRGDHERAQQEFAASLDALSREETKRSNRKGRILQGYMKLLSQQASQGDQQAIDELLKVTAVQQSGRVQRAFNAGAARAAATSPQLAEMVRQEQNLQEEAASLGEMLALMHSMPEQNRDKSRLQSTQNRLKQVQAAKDALRGEIDTLFPQYSELLSPKPLSVNDIQKRLKSAQSLLFFSTNDTETYVWAVPAQGETAFSIAKIGKDELNQIIDTLRHAVDPGAIESLEDIPAYDVKKAHRLYQELLAPVKQAWGGKEELLSVATGPLGGFPLSMLTTTATLPKDRDTLFDGYRAVDWLVKDISVTYLPSLNALPIQNEVQSIEPQKKLAFIGFGDPFFSPLQALEAQSAQVQTRGFYLRNKPKTRNLASADLSLLPRLPDTRDEILSVAQTLGADQERDVYLGSRASETSVKQADLSQYKIISFATHGLIPGDLNGLGEPALALTSPKITKQKEDGLLTMNEVLALKINADFAVLSACNTAAGEGDGSEAVSGLGRAFFYAGAKSLLVSNWPVHSGATTDLMTRMFKAHANNASLSRTEALRQTKVTQIMESGLNHDGKMLYSFAHPIFWAPFSIVGDGGR